MSETIEAIQGYTGHGISFGGDRDASYRPGLTGGVTLGIWADPEGERVGITILQMPINLNTEMIAPGIWGFGGDLSLRLNLLIVNADLGSKANALTGDDQTALGVTPFARVGFGFDFLNLEAGSLVYSGHDAVSSGRGYVMLNFNVPSLFGINYGLHQHNMANSPGGRGE